MMCEMCNLSQHFTLYSIQSYVCFTNPVPDVVPTSCRSDKFLETSTKLIPRCNESESCNAGFSALIEV